MNNHKTELEPHNPAVLVGAVSGSLRDEIRKAFADYFKSEGCDCCRNKSKHDEAEKRLAELLNPDMYEDGSGFDWYKYASTGH